MNLTLDELAAESVEGGANPSKTETAAPASASTIESSCKSQILVIRNHVREASGARSKY